MAVPEIAAKADALLTAWYPGPFGGTAVADVLFGRFNPCGRLPVSIPRSSEQLPVCYNQRETGVYCDMPDKPLYPFGYGLGYTTFAMTPARIDRETAGVADVIAGIPIILETEVQNTGNTAGVAVVQLYITFHETGIAARVRELKGFVRVPLEPGESEKMRFALSEKELGTLGKDMNASVGSGLFEIRLETGCGTCCETLLRLW